MRSDMSSSSETAVRPRKPVPPHSSQPTVSKKVCSWRGRGRALTPGAAPRRPPPRTRRSRRRRGTGTGRIERVVDLGLRITDIAQTPLRIFLQASLDERPHGGRCRLRQCAPHGLSLDDSGNRVRQRAAGERGSAGKHLVEQATERPDVGALVDKAAARLLGAHVGGGAKQYSLTRTAGVEHRGRIRQHLGTAFTQRRLRETEVQHFDDAVARDHHVGRLQIAMDDALFVRGVERVQDLLGQLERLSERHRSVQPLALDVLHDEVVGADVVKRTDVRMVHRRDGPSLTFEALVERAQARLDGDQSIETRVSRFPNLTHAASAEGGKNLVRTEPRSWCQNHGKCSRL